MPVVGLSSIINRTKKLTLDIADKKAARAVTAGAMVGQAFAQMLTPIDTSNLINSQYRKLERIGGGFRAMVGYTAKYAFFVHQSEGKGKGLPRKTGTKKGRYWDPDAEPKFLKKGFEDNRKKIEQVMLAEMRR